MDRAKEIIDAFLRSADDPEAGEFTAEERAGFKLALNEVKTGLDDYDRFPITGGAPVRDLNERFTIVDHQTGRVINCSLVPGAIRFLEERVRQIQVEGYTSGHDDQHINGEIKDAAVAYAMSIDDTAGDNAVDCWPWEDSDWKPCDDSRDTLAKAGALLAAEYDRLDRKERRFPTPRAVRDTPPGSTSSNIQPMPSPYRLDQS